MDEEDQQGQGMSQENSKEDYLHSSELMLTLHQLRLVSQGDVERQLIEERVEDTEQIKKDLQALREIQIMLSEMLNEQGEDLHVAEQKTEEVKAVVQETQQIIERLPKPWWYKLSSCTLI